MRQTVTAGAFKDLLRFVSNSQDPIVAKVALTVDTDFAGLFARRADDRHSPKADTVRRAHRPVAGVEFDYEQADWRSRITVTAEPAPITCTRATDPLTSWCGVCPSPRTPRQRCGYTSLPIRTAGRNSQRSPYATRHSNSPISAMTWGSLARRASPTSTC